MAKLSFGVQGPTQDWTVELEIADTDSPRILTWLASPESGYGTVTENVQYTEPDLSWSPGSGGGGGGASRDNNTPGNGGNGGRGEIWVIQYADDPTHTYGYSSVSYS